MAKQKQANFTILEDGEDDDSSDGSVQTLEEDSGQRLFDFGSFDDQPPPPLASTIEATNMEVALNIDANIIGQLLQQRTDVQQDAKPAESLPSLAKMIYLNPGFGSHMVNLTNYQHIPTAMAILEAGKKYISTNFKINKKLKLQVTISPVKEAPNTSVYYAYLKQLCAYIVTDYPLSLAKREIGLPLIKAGRNEIVICGCCGIQLNNAQFISHVREKVIAFEKFFKNKWSCCPWCDIEFDNDESSLIHWYDEGHTIVACRNVTGEIDGGVNDARLHGGLPLPYTPYIQSAMSLYVQMAPVASIILAQRVTKIDLANTNELSACLSIEMALMDESDYWLPDCATCNQRYYAHNVVHYSTIGSLDPDSKYEQQVCGHYVPQISKQFLGKIGLSLFDDMVDKLNGKQRTYTSSTFRTAARKDQFDDETSMRKRFGTIFASYNVDTKSTASSFVNYIIKGQTSILPGPVQTNEGSGGQLEKKTSGIKTNGNVLVEMAGLAKKN